MPTVSLDHRLLLLARTRGHAPVLDGAARLLSRAGEHGAGWLALGAIAAVADRARRPAWLRSVAAVGAAYGANQAIKLAVPRRRPELPGLAPLAPTITRRSFPSAHAATSFAAARAYGALIPAAPLYAVAALVGCSRPYLGVHFPSDVAAGALLGTAVAGLARDAASAGAVPTEIGSAACR